MPGGPELLLIAGVIMLLFGAKKLPEFARSLGKAKGEFKRGIEEEELAHPELADPETRTAEVVVVTDSK